MSVSVSTDCCQLARRSTDEWANTHGSTRSARIAYLFQSGLHSDVKLIVGDKKESLKSHKVILMAISPVFEEILMVDSTMAELEILEFEPRVFRLFLEFVYTGEWCENWKDALPLLNVANFYKVSDLAEMCTTYLKSALTFKTALPIFQQSVQYNEKILEDAAVKEICKDAYKFVESEEFLGLSPECVRKLLEQDDLAVFDEVQLFDALVRWAEAECSRQGTLTNSKYCRSVMEKMIPHIRFTQMEHDVFSMKVAARNFLSADEIVSVYLHNSIPNELRSKSDAPPMMFNSKKRGYKLPTVDCVLKRLQTVDNVLNLSPNIWNAICFKADDDIWMKSIGVNQIVAPTKATTAPVYTVEVLLDDDDGESIASKERIVEAAMNTADHYQVEFDDPVKIKKNTWYTASLRVKGAYFGSNFTTKRPNGICKGEGCNPVNIEFKDSDDEEIDKNTNAGAGQMATMGFLLYKL